MNAKLLRLLLPLLCTACLSVGPGDEPAKVRWFRPDFSEWSEPVRPQQGLPSRMAVTTASHLGTQIAWRQDDLEYGFYELWRWTNEPLEFLEEALRYWPVEADPEDQRQLKLHLEAWEEIRDSDGRGAIARVSGILVHRQDGSTRLVRGQSRVAVVGEGPIPLTAALRRALQEALIQVASDLDAAM